MTDLSWLHLSALTTERKRKLLEYLDSYLTDQRRKTFDRILPQRTRHITIVAEDTYHEHNASALIRTCDCFGIQDMHIIEEEMTFRIAKGMTKGAEKWVDVQFHNGTEPSLACMRSLRAQDYRIVATTPQPCGVAPEEIDVTAKCAVFFGREKEGLSKRVIDGADTLLHIPMYGFSESFNVSVSAAIILHTLTARLRHCASVPWELTASERLDKRIEWCLKTIQNSRYICDDFLKKNP